MKLGVGISSAAHVAILTWGMLSISPPAPEIIELGSVTMDFEASEVSKQAEGEKQAEIDETPAPKPTEKPVILPDALNTGESQRDEQSTEDAEAKPNPVEKSATAPKTPAATSNPESGPKPEEVPAPATELSSLNQPSVPVTENEVSDVPELSEVGEEFAKLPESVPVPAVKPKLPKPATAKTQERKKPKDDPARAASSAQQDQELSNEDKIAALLNKQEAASSGAKRSTEQASLGTKSADPSAKLSRREEDALVEAISRCSTGQAGQDISEDLKVTVEIQLLPNGELVSGSLAAKVSGGTQEERSRYVRSVQRYVLRCAPYDMLPKEKYDTWSEVNITFHVSEMFR